MVTHSQMCKQIHTHTVSHTQQLLCACVRVCAEINNHINFMYWSNYNKRIQLVQLSAQRFENRFFDLVKVVFSREFHSVFDLSETNVHFFPFNICAHQPDRERNANQNKARTEWLLRIPSILLLTIEFVYASSFLFFSFLVCITVAEIEAKLTSKQAILDKMKAQQHSNEIMLNGAWHSIFIIVCLSN